MRTPLLAALVLSPLAASSARADLVTYGLDGTVHPAKAGWSYLLVGNGVPFEQAFTLEKGSVRQNTLGIGYSGQGSNAAYLPISVPQPSSWILRARVKVLASEQWSFPFGSYVAFGNTGFGLMARSISPLAGSWTTLPFDGTQWHDFRVETTACGRWTLFVDDEPFSSGLGAQTSGTLWLAFGDGTGGADANTLYDFVELSVNTGIGADLNGDGAVDASDLAILLGAWGLPGVTDLDCSGSTDAGDIAILLGAWG
jgi:hypothetical protein